jgi:hypothetical protein
MRRVTGAILPPLHELEAFALRRRVSLALPMPKRLYFTPMPLGWPRPSLETDNPFDAMYWPQAIC